jgi:O-antigen/teichoic acid export membrane protein
VREIRNARDAENTENTEDVVQRVSTGLLHIFPNPPGADTPPGEIEARQLLKRTPGSYLLNQAYSLWFFASMFLLTVIITRKLSTDQYGVYAIALSAFNTIAYIVALGLEDATTTFVPRVFSEHGKAAAAMLIRRLLVFRLAILALSVGIMLFALPALAMLIAIIPLQGAANTAAGLRDPNLLAHITPIAVYVLGNGIASLITAVCAALMRMRVVFVVGSVTQLLILVVAWIGLQLGWGVDGMLWLLALASVFNALILVFWLAPILFVRRASYHQPLKPILRLGVSAWLTNLAQGALLKQISIILLAYFAISIVQIGYFNLSFQLAHAANLLLVSGFGGVAGSALAAAFVGRNRERIARSWQTLIKIETLLAAPVLMFCLFNARNIAPALYGTAYDAVGPLLAIFLFFNILVRVLGTTMHQYTLYVIGKPGKVVLGQWIGVLALVVIGIALIPHWGPAGALIADGVAQVVTGALLLVFLWRDLPRKYPLDFTLRLLLGLIVAALPSIIWHPASRFLLVVSGCMFLVLSVVALVVIRPLSAEDMDVITNVRPRVAPYLRWFARG